MGRPSKLSDEQRNAIKRRLLEGEKPADLAREFRVSKALISGVSKRVNAVFSVANQIVSAEGALAQLPIAEQLITVNLAAKLRSISSSLASAAELGAKTAHRLQALANGEVNKVDDADPLAEESLNALKGVSVLTKLANDSSAIALNLLSANRDAVKQMAEPDQLDQALTPEREREAMRRIAYLLHKSREQING